MIKKKKYTDFQIFLFVALCFCASVNLFSESLNRIALYVILPVSFVLTFLSHKKIKVNYYENMLLLLCGWAFVSSLWAAYPEAAFRELHQLLGVVLLTYIFSANSKDNKPIKLWYFIFIVLLVNCWAYANNNILTTYTGYNSEERMNDSTLDANTFSYYTVFCTFIIYLYGDIAKSSKLRKLLKMAFWMMLPISFITALLTASRQMLIIQFPFCFLLIYFRYINHRQASSRIAFFMIVFLAIAILGSSLISAYENSFLYTRTQIDLDEDSRTKLLQDAFKVGLNHFPLGVGAGNYLEYSFNKHFSHNTYLELWANLGVVGLLIFLKMLYRFISTQYKRYKKTRDKVFLAFLTFGVAFCFQNIFYSFYTGMWLMGFFILVASHSEIYYKTKYVLYE